MNNLENIKKVLESDAGLAIIDISNPDEKVAVDNRFTLIKQLIDLTPNKDNEFYEKLIKLLALCIDELYDTTIDDFPSVVFDHLGKIIVQDYCKLNSADIFKLRLANREFSKKLFDLVCSILEDNKDIKLDINTLKRLLNRNPKLSNILIEDRFLFRLLNYRKLIKILNDNQTLEKSNISIDEIYQLLLDTFQINNAEIFGELISPLEFSQNHQKIDEILSWCNAKTFVEITNIIRRNFDKEYDRFSIVKKRTEENFYERLIVELLRCAIDHEDFDFIHQIITEFKIDYNFYIADYVGESTLKSHIALSGNKIIIKDLLSNPENVQDYYWHGETCIQLYRLYAIIGDYVHAIDSFNEIYNYSFDYTDDFNDDFNRIGYSYGDWNYQDTLTCFISDICTSLSNDETVDYDLKKQIIDQILSSEKIKYINLKETLPALKEILSDEDFKALVETLVSRQNEGNLGFIEVLENNDLDSYKKYVITIASEKEIKSYLSSLKEGDPSKVLSINPIKKSQTSE